MGVLSNGAGVKLSDADGDQLNMTPAGAIPVDGSMSPQPITDNGGSITTDGAFSTRSDTYTAAANGVTVDVTTTPTKFYSVQVKGTGAVATAWSIVLEGSLDGTNFDTILAHDENIGDGKIMFGSASPSPCRYFRSRCVSITLGGATNIVVTILGIQ